MKRRLAVGVAVAAGTVAIWFATPRDVEAAPRANACYDIESYCSLNPKCKQAPHVEFIATSWDQPPGVVRRFHTDSKGETLWK